MPSKITKIKTIKKNFVKFSVNFSSLFKRNKNTRKKNKNLRYSKLSFKEYMVPLINEDIIK